MTKVTLIGHTDDQENVIQKLHKIGLVQLIDLKTSDIDLKNAVPTEDMRELSDALLRVSHIISILKLAPVKQTWSQKIFGLETTKRTRVRRKNKQKVVEEAERFLDKHEKELLELEEKHSEALAHLDEYKEYRNIIKTLLQHNIPIDVLGRTEYVSFTAGELVTANVGPLKKELEEEMDGRVHVETRQADKRTSVIVIIALREQEEKVNFLAKKYGLATYAFRMLPPVERPLEWVEERINSAEEQLEKATDDIEALHGRLLDMAIFLREELEIIEERFEAVHKLKRSDKFFVMQGWVTSNEKAMLKRSVRNTVILEDLPGEEEEPPVRLSNPRIYKPFEWVTELYALPKYKDLDPTFITAPLFLIYAGFMLTDFIYGLGLVILGGTLYLLFRKYQEGVANTSLSVLVIGLFSMLFGFLTGSYLGDAPKYFWGIPTEQLAIWRDPLSDPLYFLILSLIVGLVHLNIGLLLGLIEDIRKKEWKNMVSERVIWWILQIGVLAFALKWNTTGQVLLGLTLVLVLFLQGPLGLLGLTGFMGDVISYSRLFALALATAGIAMTVNLLMDMLAGIPYIGLLAAALIFIIGHLFSFAMNSLGGFVHSIRLQFVEFFGKFYEGGGDKFEPFKEERVYTEVAE